MTKFEAPPTSGAVDSREIVDAVETRQNMTAFLNGPKKKGAVPIEKRVPLYATKGTTKKISYPSSYIGLVFHGKGSVYPKIVLPCLYSMIIAFLFILMSKEVDAFEVDNFDPSSFTTLGIALSFLLVFRNMQSYQRFWDGRGDIGVILATLRDLKRKFCFIKTKSAIERNAKHNLNRQLLIFYETLRQDLENEGRIAFPEGFLSSKEEQELCVMDRRPLLVLAWLTQTIHFLYTRNSFTDSILRLIDRDIDSLMTKYHSTMKLVNTPLPLPYAQLLAIALLTFTTVVPLVFLPTWEWLTPAPSVIVTAVLFGINEIAKDLENPFGTDFYDLPLEEYGMGLEADILFTDFDNREYEPSKELVASKRKMSKAVSKMSVLNSTTG